MSTFEDTFKAHTNGNKEKTQEYLRSMSMPELEKFTTELIELAKDVLFERTQRD